MSKKTIYKPERLTKTQEKVIKYFENKSHYVDSLSASSDLKMSRETLNKNLKTLDDMNVLERNYKYKEVLVLVNSEQDWQVYQSSMPKSWKNDLYY